MVVHKAKKSCCASLQCIAFTGNVRSLIRAFAVRITGVDFDSPASNPDLPGQAEGDLLRICIEQQQEGIVSDPAASLILLFYGIAMQQETKATGMVLIPLSLGHFFPIRP